MPNHKSAEKRHRQSLVRRARNRAAKSTMKTLLKKARSVATQGGESVATAEKKAVSYVDKIAAKGIIHKRKAARLVSRLSRRLNGEKEARGQ